VPTFTAPAKLNLALSVGDPLPEGLPFAGYHPIASWMALLDLADEVAIEPAASRSSGPFASSFQITWHDGSPVEWPTETDLTVRAHAAVERAIGRSLPVRIRVRKRIPAGGGLGGGSSDAAAVIAGLDEVFGLELGPDRRRTIALGLGTDLPFFLDAPVQGAVVTGVGDRVEPLVRSGAFDDGAWRVVLIFPPFGCPTGEVYRERRAERRGPADDDRVAALARVPIDPSALFNDLAGPAERVRPQLAVRHEIASAGGVPVLVSGSGSTLFALLGPGEDADRLVRAVPNGWAVRPATLAAW
jgi:4-diphosphocytidyl-2-C-methyl-D-erythritol kinase